MYRGRPEDLRQAEAKAAELAAQVADLLTRIETLGAGRVLPSAGRIAGPGFDIRRTPTGWTARS
ncbi:hypothetical protein [Streptomyces sp. NPDC012508]|uniref:hypothetical protein n=1 Tax=Streptomyces sp. NPDC012508 TaxID=3364837 RepID=UPI00367E40B3